MGDIPSAHYYFSHFLGFYLPEVKENRINGEFCRKMFKEEIFFCFRCDIDASKKQLNEKVVSY